MRLSNPGKTLFPVHSSPPHAQNHACRIAALDGDSAHLLLRGDFGRSDALRLFELLALDAARRNLTVDLAQTTYIDASILGVFARIAKRRRDLRVPQLRVVNTPEHIRALFSMCEFEEMLDFCEGRRRQLREQTQ